MMMFDEKTENLLCELEKTQKDFWNISRATANFLNMMIKVGGYKNGLEVGTSNGYSGIWLGKALKENGGKLTTIEFYEKRINPAKEHFGICCVDDVITVKQGEACEVLAELDDEYDFAFIDANKREYIKYFELINPKLKCGGMIAADNITSHPEKVQEFVDAISADENYQVEILDLPAGLLIAYRGGV